MVADIVWRYNDELVLEIIKDTCISVIKFTIGSFMKTFDHCPLSNILIFYLSVLYRYSTEIHLPT